MNKLVDNIQLFVDTLKERLEANDEVLISAGRDFGSLNDGYKIVITNKGYRDTYSIWEDYNGVHFIRVFGG